MRITETPSPNFDNRGGKPVDILLLHYTGMKTAEEALHRLCDEEARVSSHYFVDEAGVVHRLVEEAERAWHAGLSFWSGDTNVNARSIGIEIVNPGHEWGYVDFPEAQIDAVIELCSAIVGRHDIPPFRVLAHSDVAPARKQDPGERFPWDRLAQAGIGLWPDEIARGLGKRDSGDAAVNSELVRRLNEKFARYGYERADKPTADETMVNNVVAFLRHYWPPEAEWREWTEMPPLLSYCERIVDRLLAEMPSTWTAHKK